MNSKPSLQVFVISLERSTERRGRVEEQLNQTGIQWQFLNAVDGYALPSMPSSYKQSKVKRLQGYELTPGEIGCFLSHIKAWELCVQNNATTLVFEDDFLVGENLEMVIEDLLSIADQWSLVRLSGIYETNHQILKNRPAYELVKNLAEPCGTAAYMIQPAAAKILLENAADNPTSDLGKAVLLLARNHPNKELANRFMKLLNRNGDGAKAAAAIRTRGSTN
jgi:glycosyl transferase family 25